MGGFTGNMLDTLAYRRDYCDGSYHKQEYEGFVDVIDDRSHKSFTKDDQRSPSCLQESRSIAYCKQIKPEKFGISYV